VKLCRCKIYLYCWYFDRGNHYCWEIIFGPTKYISTLKYVLLILLLDALPSTIVFISAFDIIYNFLHSFTLYASLSALVSSTLGATLSTYLNGYLMRRTIR